MPPGLALIVDHGLRPGSNRTADQAAKQAAVLGHEPKILVWKHGKVPKTQAAYRAGRSALLAHACQNAGVTELWTGHQQDDQAETLMLRLSKGSGLLGLSGMALSTWLGNTRLRRPLLTISKSQILAELNQRGLRGLQDPSNEDLTYPRVVWRKYLASNPSLKPQLIDLSQRVGAKRNAALVTATELPVRIWAPGCLDLGESLRYMPATTQQEILAACVRWVGGRAFAPLNHLLRFLSSPQRNGAACTTGGTVMTWRRTQNIYELRPEWRRPSDPDPYSVRTDQTQNGLWFPKNQVRYGGVIVGETPRLDQEFVTKKTPMPFRD